MRPEKDMRPMMRMMDGDGTPRFEADAQTEVDLFDKGVSVPLTLAALPTVDPEEDEVLADPRSEELKIFIDAFDDFEAGGIFFGLTAYHFDLSMTII